MIKAKDAIAVARSLIGTPYSELDCINLIKKVIRDAPGGVPGYTTAGTNALWRSYDAAAKYKDLTWRQEGLDGAAAGMLAFKMQGDDVHHVGLVTGDATVIHASSTLKGTVETPLDGEWKLLARHRLIGVEEGMKPENGTVRTQGGMLNVRASAGGRVIAQIENGTKAEILSASGEWLNIRLEDGTQGVVSAAYIERTDAQQARAQIRIVDAQGNIFMPQGCFTVSLAGTD
ncbi:MAG: SH3 domain-containing protein [Clostridia bacterium]|nr:SH3 domain-containing protein [Clostridia bacterium]